MLGEPVFGRQGDGRSTLRRVGAIVEEPAFWRFLTGRRNLEYFARAAGPAADRAARLRRIDEVLRTVGLEAAAGKRVKAYSQGMRQRLGIALALLGAPDVLLLDEPTNGLDPQGMREVRVLLRRLAEEGTTVFVSSHLLFEVEAMCDVIGVLAHGRLVAEGRPSEMRKARKHLWVEVGDRVLAQRVLDSLLGVTIEAVEARAELGDGSGALRLNLSGDATAASVNRALVGAGVSVSALEPQEATLEDVFLSLVEGEDAPR